jgi:hypothetical protein
MLSKWASRIALATALLVTPAVAEPWPQPCHNSQIQKTVLSIVNEVMRQRFGQAAPSEYPRDEMMNKCMLQHGDTSICLQLLGRAEQLQNRFVKSLNGWPLFELAERTLTDLYEKQEKDKRFSRPTGDVFFETQIDTSWIVPTLWHVKPSYRLVNIKDDKNLSQTSQQCKGELVVDLPQISKIENNNGNGISVSAMAGLYPLN